MVKDNWRKPRMESDAIEQRKSYTAPWPSASFELLDVCGGVACLGLVYFFICKLMRSDVSSYMTGTFVRIQDTALSLVACPIFPTRSTSNGPACAIASLPASIFPTHSSSNGPACAIASLPAPSIHLPYSLIIKWSSLCYCFWVSYLHSHEWNLVF